jgi:hypothetical protein
MTKNDLRSDLLADLQLEANARPLPAATAPVGASPRTLPSDGKLRPPTPSLDLRVTPLRWARPGLVSPDPGLGLGLGVRVGPVQVSLTLGG